MNITIESLRSGDTERRASLDVEAFGSTDSFDPDQPTNDSDREVCAYHGNDLIGAVSTLPGGQYFGGNSISMGGVAGVAVRGDHRGQGLARQMMIESIGRMAQRGELISTLYPSTTSLYRSVGYEIAGDWTETTLPAAAASAKRNPDISVRDVGSEDLSTLRSIYETVAPDHNGWRDRADIIWEYEANRRSKSARIFGRVGYVGDRAVWALSYRYQDPSPLDPTAGIFDIRILDMVAVDDSAASDALGFLASSSTMAGSIISTSPRHGWTHLLAHPPSARPVRSWSWMTRLVDVPAALAARGYPMIDHAPVAIAVSDDYRSENNGTWYLGLENGNPLVTPTDDAPQITLTQPLLASIYTGLTDPVEAFNRGRLVASTRRDADSLKAIFSPGNPTCPDFF